MNKNKRFLSFEARMAYRKNGTIQITSPEPDLGGFFLTMKPGTASYDLAIGALREADLVDPEPKHKGRRLTRAEVSELTYRGETEVLMGLNSEGQPVYWDSDESGLSIVGLDTTPTAYTLRGRMRTNLSSSNPPRPELFFNQLEQDDEEIFRRVSAGKAGDPKIYLVHCGRFLTDDQAENLAMRLQRPKEFRRSVILADIGWDRETTRGRALDAEMSTLYTNGSWLKPGSGWDWNSLPSNMVYWKPKGEVEPKLIELV